MCCHIRILYFNHLNFSHIMLFYCQYNFQYLRNTSEWAETFLIIEHSTNIRKISLPFVFPYIFRQLAIRMEWVIQRKGKEEGVNDIYYLILCWYLNWHLFVSCTMNSSSSLCCSNTIPFTFRIFNLIISFASVCWFEFIVVVLVSCSGKKGRFAYKNCATISIFLCQSVRWAYLKQKRRKTKTKEK